MEDNRDYKQTLHEPHVPVEILRKNEIREWGRDCMQRVIHLWCCFENPGSRCLLSAAVKFNEPIAISAAISLKLSIPSSLDVVIGNPETYRKRIFDQKIDDGMRVIDGKWYINIRTGRIVNRLKLASRVSKKVNVLPVGMNGFGGANLSPKPQISIAARLAEANPMADQWLFPSN